MKKNLILSILTAALLLVVAGGVSAQGLNVDVSTNTNVELKNTGNKSTTTKGNATSSVSKAKNATTSTTTVKTKGEVTAEAHRSAVATFVKSLLSVANREGGIGAEVRVIAQAQNESASTTVEAVEKIEARNKIKTFLIGSDYKTIGELRSELAKTDNNLEKLKSLRDKAVTASAKAELDVQIAALEKAQVELEAFVDSHEDSVSIFGWFVKLFVD
jgi:hypothetical protein